MFGLVRKMFVCVRYVMKCSHRVLEFLRVLLTEFNCVRFLNIKHQYHVICQSSKCKLSSQVLRENIPEMQSLFFLSSFRLKIRDRSRMVILTTIAVIPFGSDFSNFYEFIIMETS